MRVLLCGTREMAQQFRLLAALLKEPACTSKQVLSLPFQGIQYLLLASIGAKCLHGAQTSMQTKDLHKENKRKI